VKKIIIAGAGFAGISAANSVKRTLSSECQVTVFDKNEYTTMLPSLPDVSGGVIDRAMSTGDIRGLLPPGTELVKEEIKRIDLDAQNVSADKGEYNYDYLLISAGSVTEFFGFKDNKQDIYTLDSLQSALKIKQEFARYLDVTERPVVVISGAGFTGLEAACALREYSKGRSKDVDMVLVEKTSRVLGSLPEKISGYVETLISGLGFKVVRNSSVKSFNGKDVELTGGEVFKNAFFVWTAGTRISIEHISGEFKSLNDGRIIADEFLRVPGYENVFVAGDCAAIKNGNGYLRKAVNFAVYSGKSAGKNIALSIMGKKLEKFKPVDLGWVIPLYPSSVGNVMGVTVKGKLGLMLHYFMCGYRNYSFKNMFAYFLKALKI
jgi:NADH dehydrogenase